MNLKSLLSSVRTTKIPSYGKAINPMRDWFVVVSVALILLVVSVGWNMWLFIHAINGEAIGEMRGEAEAYDLTALEKVHAIFDARAVEEERYRNDYRFVDPSL